MTENFEHVNHLVLNFYPDGYSIAVKLNEFPVFTSETILETARISYEETSLLDYIGNEELPPLLVEMIDSSPKLSQYKIWHNGCLILQVRDKIDTSKIDSSRSENCIEHDKDNDNYIGSQSAAKNSLHLLAQNKKSFTNNNGKVEQQWPSNWHPSYDGKLNSYNYSNCTDHNQGLTHEESSESKSTDRNFFILLKPTNLSMLYDVLNLTGSKCWSTQERLQLEAQIVLHNSPSLTLEPDAPKTCTESVIRWPSDAQKQTATSNRHPRVKSKQLSYKQKLKNIYVNRPIPTTYPMKTNGNSKSNNNINSRSITNNAKLQDLFKKQSADECDESALSTLPPELTLQQFLASKRTTKKVPLPFGHVPRFHRFKRHNNHG